MGWRDAAVGAGAGGELRVGGRVHFERVVGDVGDCGLLSLSDGFGDGLWRLLGLFLALLGGRWPQRRGRARQVPGRRQRDERGRGQGCRRGEGRAGNAWQSDDQSTRRSRVYVS